MNEAGCTTEDAEAHGGDFRFSSVDLCALCGWPV